MGSHDQRRGQGDEWFAIPLREYAPSGKPRVHYPELLLAQSGGWRVAIELELMLKSRSRLEAILAAYRAERRIASVVYFTDSDAIRSAARHESDGGARRGVEVEYFEPAPEPDVERAGENLRAGGSER